MSWPGFTYLSGAWFLLALIPLVILYFLKLKRPRREIASLVLWQSVINDQRVNSPFQKFRRNLLLLLQFLLLLLVILALMQPYFQGGLGAGDHLPILIDTSASMAAIDPSSGKSRLDRAKEEVAVYIESMRSGQNICLITFAGTSRRVTEFTDDPRLLLRALDGINVSHEPGRLDDALRMAAAFSRTVEIERVLVYSDNNLPSRVDFELPFRIESQPVGSEVDNLGITELTARRVGAEDWDVFVRVAASGTEPMSGDLQLLQDGKVVAVETVSAERAEPKRMVFTLTSARPMDVQAKLVPDSNDALVFDNEAWIHLPESRDLSVWASPRLMEWRKALRVLKRLDVSPVSESEPSKSRYDLIITDSVDTAGSETGVVIHVGQIPPELADVVVLNDDISDFVDWLRTAPLLRHVQLGEVQIGVQPAYVGENGVAEVEERGFEVIGHGNVGPLILQKREGLHVQYWFLFATDRSTLPYRVAFPVMVANAVEIALKSSELSEVQGAPTGILPPRALEPDRQYTLRRPDGSEATVHTTETGELSGVSAPLIGTYQILDGGEVVAAVGASLLSPLETSLVAVDELQSSDMSIDVSRTETVRSAWTIWWPLALAAFGLLMFEWWYFQRARGIAG